MEAVQVAGGYTVCPGLPERPCGEWFIPPSGSATATICPECRRVTAEVVNEVIAVEVAGHLTSVGGRDRRQRRRGSYANTERGKAVSRARHRALARLSAAYPDIFEALVAEELAKMGEAPVRTRTDALRRLNRIALDALERSERSGVEGTPAPAR